MKSWIVYAKKDWRLMKAEFLFAVASITGLEILGFVLVLKDRIDVETQVQLSLWIIGIFMPVCMAMSLSKERKNAASLWFVFPVSGYRLISAKLAAAFVSQLILSIISMTGSAVIMLVFDSSIDLLILKAIWCTALLEFGVGLVLFVVFISALTGSVNHYLPKKRGFLSFLLFCGLFVGLLYFVTTDFYQVFRWGSFSMGLLFKFPETGMSGVFNDLYISDYVFDLFMFAGLFIISGWLLDKKVEV